MGGVVINADSIQVYRDLQILTARPGAESLERAPHRLFGSVPGSERCSAGRWRDLALAEIGAAESIGRVPILVGGTGLYLEALTKGIAEVPPVPASIRAASVDRHQEYGGHAMHTALAGRDPVMASRLNPGDSQRLIRAWEVLEATGRSLADWQKDMAKPPAHLRFHRILLLPPRENVYATCDRRFQAMIEDGAVEEVATLRSQNLDPALPVMKAIGVPELSSFLDGKLSLDVATARAQMATRHYAKRQMTWFRNRVLRQVATGSTPILLDAQYCKSFFADILTKFRLQR